MANMGNLRKYMPITHITFLIACLAIAGIPPFSGFFSKDEILAASFMHDKVIFVTLWIVAGLTAFYMFRLYYSIFWSEETVHEHVPHESPKIMTYPLLFLALLSIVTGLIPFGKLISADRLEMHTHIDWMIAGASIFIAVTGILVARRLYRRHNARPAAIASAFGSFYRAVLHKFYIDEVWYFITRKVIFRHISTPIAKFDRKVIDGAMDLTGNTTVAASKAVKGLQSGRVQWYAWVFIAGVLIIAICFLATV
jgi:NADH-quinone oxidoreductase subunit L